MAGILSLVCGIALALLAVLGTAYVLVWTGDASGTETRLSNWSLVVAMALFVTMLLWSVWSAV